MQTTIGSYVCLFVQFDAPPLVLFAFRGIGWMLVLFLIDAGANLAGRPLSENRNGGGVKADASDDALHAAIVLDGFSGLCARGRGRRRGETVGPLSMHPAIRWARHRRAMQREALRV